MSDIEYCNNCGLLHDPDDGKCLGCELIQEKKVIQSKLDKAVEALEFYANERNWEESIDNPNAFCIIKYCDAEEREATYDCIGGKKARETKKQIEELGEQYG